MKTGMQKGECRELTDAELEGVAGGQDGLPLFAELLTFIGGGCSKNTPFTDDPHPHVIGTCDR